MNVAEYPRPKQLVNEADTSMTPEIVGCEPALVSCGGAEDAGVMTGWPLTFS
jgi:hypothetical protein